MPELSELEESVSRALTVKKIVDAIDASGADHPLPFALTRRLKHKKSALIHQLFCESDYWKARLVEMAQQEMTQAASREQAGRERVAERKRKSRRTARANRNQAEAVNEAAPPADSRFLKSPSGTGKVPFFEAFYDATTTDALQKQTCAVCARSLNRRAARIRTISLANLPNAERLRPSSPHRAHSLVEGYLLAAAGCTQTEDGWMVNTCRQCYRELKKPNISTPPKFSLANGLCIGGVPPELLCLSLAEQLLIARVYPRVFVVKLFPKSNARHGLDDDQLQGALRGNVTSFELNSDAIADMLGGNLMPQKPEILASVLSVTFIGKGKIPNPAALRLFQVRRHKVAAALEWLRTNNPKYYGDIKIDTSRLAALPATGEVPPEILLNIRQETDDSVLNVESDGYVPDHDEEDEDSANINQLPPPSTDENGDQSTDPDVVPLQYLGVMDNDLTKTSTSDILASGFSNMGQNGGEGGYAVRHGGPVNTFGRPPTGAPPADPDRPNFWERAFPLLYPYGTGGIEHDRPVPLSFIEHVRWSLQYHDRRFRLHSTFAFVAFGIYQRRQVLASARVQMKRRNFDEIARTLSTITPEDLRTAAEEEERGQAPSNPSIAVLKRYVNATSSRVVGSDAARYQLRSQIWSTSVVLNPPTLWMTINPDDLHDPIAQVFAGEEIDMDNFVQTAGPDKNQRSRNIARDPYAAAEFFNFLVTTILEKLLGVRATANRVYSTGGVLGHINAYFGVVECQGRGTLHLHMLGWLKDAPSPDRLKTLLRTPEFKSRVVDYLKANVRAFLPELATNDHLQAVPPDPEVCYSRFPDPSTPEPTFNQSLRELETKVVRTKQIHSCGYGKCLKVTKHGQLKCKRRAPFELSTTDSVDDDGNYRIKRTLGYLNSYCPAITVTAKCNNDIKLLLHGTATNNITFYVTGYIAKKQGKSYNVSGLLANGLMYNHFASEEYRENLRDRQRLLLLRAVNILNREQEVPAPLAISHLMGWGDVYRSHHYVPIYWSSFIGEIYDKVPTLKHPRPRQEGGQDSSEQAASTREETDDNVDNSDSEAIVLRLNQHGQLHFRSQVEDYVHRGDFLNNYSVLDFLVGTYEQKGRPKAQPEEDVGTGNGSEGESESEDETRTRVEDEAESRSGSEDESETGSEGRGRRRRRRQKRGRPAHKRVPYQSSHPYHGSHVRVVRPAKHNSLPNFIGPRIPRRNDPDQMEFYAASILTLLKPWRKITDLKNPEQSWANALESFLASSDPRIQDIVSSFDHYYECKAAAESEQRKLQVINEDDEEDNGSGRNAIDEDVDMEPPEDTSGIVILTEDQITPDMIAKAKLEAADDKHPEFGREAVNIGRAKGIFASPVAPIISSVARGGDADALRLSNWQKTLKRLLEVPSSAAMTSSVNGGDTGDITRVEDLSTVRVTTNNEVGTVIGLLTQHALDPAAVRDLFPEQLRAFNIVRHHLAQTLEWIHNGAPRPSQLLMLLVGEGGTGKSKVIQTITAEFERRGVAGMLIKAAYTGIAASLIQGKTTHNIGCISVGRKSLSDTGKAKLAQVWKGVQYLIIDEYSMLSKDFFAQLSRHIQVGRIPHDPLAASADFGAVNVLICGDGHQFPPVIGGAPAALYSRPAPGASVEVKLGWDLFSHFTKVVILRRQVRVTDERWRAFLTSLRRGQVQPEQVTMLKSLVLTDPSCGPVDFQRDPWQNVALITPRNSVRHQWNEAAVIKHCQKEGRQLFICPANDTIRKRRLTKREQLVAALANPSEKPGGLPDSVMLAVGMKVMVTINVETDLDIANGARGEIVDIVLSPNEPPFEPTTTAVTLQHLPVYVLVKLARHTRDINLPGLEPGVIPIVPASKPFRIMMDIEKGGRLVRTIRTVRRLQFPITPAYSFTDYRSQGQTIESVIVDITNPPTGGPLNLYNIYVALSRSSGTSTIRILRDFDAGLLMQPLDSYLAEEQERLENLDASTLTWYNQMSLGSVS